MKMQWFLYVLEVTEEKSSKKKKKKQKSEDLTNGFDNVNWDEGGGEDEDWKPQEATIQATSTTPKATFFKKAKSQVDKPICLVKEKNRRISLALSENKISSLNEIDRSMQDSPDIPYEPEKRPRQGVLKSKSASSTPTTNLTKAALVHNTLMNGKSKAAKKLGLNSSRLMFF